MRRCERYGVSYLCFIVYIIAAFARCMCADLISPIISR